MGTQPVGRFAGQSIWRCQARHAHRKPLPSTARHRSTKSVRPAMRISHSTPEVKPLTDWCHARLIPDWVAGGSGDR